MTLWLDFSPTLLLRIKGVKIMEKDKDFLGTEPIGKLLLRLAIPTLAAQLINMLYNVVDRIYIGHIPKVGALALTGVGVCMPLIMIVSAFAVLVGNGGAPRASIYMGQNNKEDAEKTLGNCFATQILVAIVLGTIFVQLTLGLNAFITAQGFAKTGMLSVLIGAVINIVLDPIFIFGLHMGVRGAALATIISQACSCIWVVSFLFGKKTFLKIQRKNMKLEARIILPSLALGLATFIMQASESIITVCFNSSLLKYGGDIAVGAMTILTSVMQFAMLPLQGLGQGAQPILSYNYGAKNVDRVRGTFRLLLKVSVGYAVILWLCVELFPQIFVSMFTSDAALLAFGKTALRVYMAAMFMFGFQIACQMGFTSLGCAPESIIVAVMRKFVLLIPLIYIVPHIWSADRTMGVYLAEPIADFFAVTFTMILFSNRFKKALKKIEK